MDNWNAEREVHLHEQHKFFSRRSSAISKIFSRFPVSFARSYAPNATQGNKTKIHFRCKSNVSYAGHINPTEIARINSLTGPDRNIRSLKWWIEIQQRAGANGTVQSGQFFPPPEQPSGYYAGWRNEKEVPWWEAGVACWRWARCSANCRLAAMRREIHSSESMVAAGSPSSRPLPPSFSLPPQHGRRQAPPTKN